jgi:hypothetical protein
VISRQVLAWLGIIGIAFDLLGGLYLAYDLLGGRRGPLRTITRAATYALVFTAFYTAGFFVPFGPITGAGLGTLLGIEYGQQRGEAIGLMFAVLRGAVFGLAGLALYGARFGLVFGLCAAAGLVAVYRLRFSVARDYPSADPKIRITLALALAQAMRAGTVAAAAVIAGAVTSGHAGTIALFAVRLAVVSWLAGFAVASAAPAVESWADRVPARHLGIVGAVLILTGLLTQSIQYWVVIVNLRVG